MIYKKRSSNANKKEWKFIKNLKNILIDKEKALIYSKRENWVIYDPRIKSQYTEGHFPNSIHVTFFRLKYYILRNDKKTHVLIISELERTYVPLISWAKYHGFNNIYLLKGGMNFEKDKKYLVKN